MVKALHFSIVSFSRFNDRERGIETIKAKADGKGHAESMEEDRCWLEKEA